MVVASAWAARVINFRPDQIVKFEEAYPDQQLGPFIRNLVDVYLDGKDNGKNRLQNVRELKKKKKKELAMLDEEEKVLESEEHKQLLNKSLERDRLQFISDHPRYLELYRAGTMSTKGYQDLQRELKLSSKQQVVEWLNKQVEVDSS